ncbi:GTP-binding protein [Candidatus Thorarchaeota archaeon]|nr:MAG: GTP-binding protein [Candidatus Thorarchaeota archaeon]
MSMRVPIYKTILIGEGGVGKTSLTVRYTENRFEEDMKMTIGVNFASKKVKVDSTDATLMLWDMGGQPRFRDVVGDYFRGARAAICVYDATRFFSLERLNDWIDRVKENAPDCKFFFVANKIDERSNGFGVSPEDGTAFAQQFDAPMMEVSAKTGDGVTEMFETVTRMLLNA